NYSATKAYNLVLAEGLWAELRADGVDVLVSCAGATRTPNYVASEPEDANVPVQEPEQVAAETLDALGKKTTLFPARVLRVTHFAFRHLMGRRTAVRLMAYASNKAYKEQENYSTGDRCPGSLSSRSEDRLEFVQRLADITLQCACDHHAD